MQTITINGLPISYVVLAVDKVRGQLTVRFFNDDLPEGFVVGVDLPVVGGRILALQDADLKRYLSGICPFGEFERVALLRDAPPALDYLDALVEPDVVPPPPPLPENEVPRRPLPGEQPVIVVTEL